MRPPWTDGRPPRTQINQCFPRCSCIPLLSAPGLGDWEEVRGVVEALRMQSVTARGEKETGKGPCL